MKCEECPNYSNLARCLADCDPALVSSVTKTMDEFEEWANKNLSGVYRPIVRTKNGRGYTNEHLNDCWDTWKAARR